MILISIRGMTEKKVQKILSLILTEEEEGITVVEENIVVEEITTVEEIIAVEGDIGVAEEVVAKIKGMKKLLVPLHRKTSSSTMRIRNHVVEAINVLEVEVLELREGPSIIKEEAVKLSVEGHSISMPKKEGPVINST